MSNWKKTKHRGVRVKESPTKMNKKTGKPDKSFLIRYGRDGKVIQEAVGWASEGITAQYAAL